MPLPPESVVVPDPPEVPRTREDAPGSPNGAGGDSGQGPPAETRSRGKCGSREYPADGGHLSGAAGLRQLAASRVEHTVPYGARDAFARNVQRLVAESRDWMLEQFNSPENVRMYVEAVTEGARKKDRTCIRMLHEIYDLAGVKESMVLQFLARVGAASLEEAESRLERVRGAAEMDAHQRFAAVMDYAEMYLNKHPEHRVAAVRRLGGQVEVRSDSFARVVNDGP